MSDYILHLPLTQMDGIIECADRDMDYSDIDTDVKYATWVEYDGETFKHERLSKRRKRLKRLVDERNANKS